MAFASINLLLLITIFLKHSIERFYGNNQGRIPLNSVIYCDTLGGNGKKLSYNHEYVNLCATIIDQRESCKKQRGHIVHFPRIGIVESCVKMEKRLRVAICQEIHSLKAFGANSSHRYLKLSQWPKLQGEIPTPGFGVWWDADSRYRLVFF